MNRLLRAVGVYGVALAGLTVGAVYAASQFAPFEFGMVALLLLVGGLILGPTMFARGGSSPVAHEDVDSNTMDHADEAGGTSRIPTGSDTPTKALLGIYLLGVAAFAAVGLALTY